jgi:ABC-2 type transport system permease protein
MLRSVALKTLRDARRGFVLWSAGLVGMVALMISVWPTVRDDPSMTEFVKRYPDALKNMIGFGGALDYTTPAGYLGAELFSFMVPLLLIIATVAAGSGALAGEEERGTMELMLAAPVSRDRVVAEKLAALVGEVAGLSAVLWAALLVGAAVVGMEISAWHLAAATLSALLVAVLYGAVALALGAATGRRSLAIGLTSALAVAAYLVNVLAPLASSLAGAKRLSPFYYYSSSDPLRRGLDAGDLALLAAVAAAAATAAIVAFRRRDIAV